MNLKFWVIFELSLQDFQHSRIIRTHRGKFSCSDQWGLDLNQLVQMTKMSQSCSVEVNKTWTARGKPSQHWHLSYSRSEVWHCIQSAKLPAKHPDIILFSTVHQVPFTPVKCIYFSLVSFWIMSPIRSENTEEMQHNLEQKHNKSPELLVEFLFQHFFSSFFK